MGELIKKIGNISIHENVFDVEINEPEIHNGEYIIHIQNKHFRFVLDEKEFFEMINTVIESKRKLMNKKGSIDDR